jgi:hypothetical protein
MVSKSLTHIAQRFAGALDIGSSGAPAGADRQQRAVVRGDVEDVGRSVTPSTTATRSCHRHDVRRRACSGGRAPPVGTVTEKRHAVRAARRLQLIGGLKPAVWGVTSKCVPGSSNLRGSALQIAG